MEESKVVVEEMFPDITIQDHVRSKQMWAGSHEQMTSREFVADANFKITRQKITYPQSLFKCLDEAVVNSLDHLINMLKETNDNVVTYINVDYDEKGRITIENNGRGVPTDWHSVAKKYTPQLIFGEVFKGSNIKKDPDSITGGTNGVGIKIANILSTEFEIETVYRKQNTVTKYVQKWTNGMTSFTEPVITDLSKAPQRKQYTRISFMPDYVGAFGYKSLSDVNFAALNMLFRMRLMQAAAYAGYSCAMFSNTTGVKRVCKVQYNGVVIPINSMKDLVNYVDFSPEKSDEKSEEKTSDFSNEKTNEDSDDFEEPVEKIQFMMGADTKFPWEIVIVVSNKYGGNKMVPQISNVNGVAVGSGGKHIDVIVSQIIASVKDVVQQTISGKKNAKVTTNGKNGKNKFSKFATSTKSTKAAKAEKAEKPTKLKKQLETSSVKIQSTHITNNIFIFANTQIPGVNWSSQIKSEAIYDGKKLTNYKIPDKPATEIANGLKEIVMRAIYGESSVIGAPTGSKTSRVLANKYYGSRHAGKKKRAHPCMLLLAEGDSAISMLRRGLKEVKNAEYYGMMALGGVIINVRKQCSIEPGDSTSPEKAEKAINDFLEDNPSDVDSVSTETSSVVSTVESTTETTTETNQTKKHKHTQGRITMKKKLAENKFFQIFLQVTGLNFNYRYDPASPTYRKEMATLRYDKLVGCVDQDHDGVGFIFSLIINIFVMFWPSLLQQGYICRFITPLLRAYPKSGGRVFDFASKFLFEDWLKQMGSSASRYRIDYIKGLGTHEPAEVKHMFKGGNFENKIFTYLSDNGTNDIYEKLFGESSEPRKKILTAPPNLITKELELKQLQTRIITATDHALYECEPHKRENLKRKLWHVIDGMNEVGRKILNGSIKYFGKKPEKVKITILQGAITKSQHYHYGNSSLEDAIFGKGFLAVGGVQLPVLLPFGEFGSRARGGSDHASSRYASTALNRKLVEALYPPDDMQTLEYIYDDNTRVEPKFFVPILPTAILESTEMPADGWKIKVWARDVFSVLRCVRAMIMTWNEQNDALESNPKDFQNIKILPLKQECRGFKGTFRSIRGKFHSVGTYTILEPQTATTGMKFAITELPLRKWFLNYCEYLEASKRFVKCGPAAQKQTYQLIEEIYCDTKCTDDNIWIEIHLCAPTAQFDPFAYLESRSSAWMDGLEDYFELCDYMDNQLNFINIDDSVLECKSYEEVVKHWFYVRKSYYAKRIKRNKVLNALYIQYLENLIRYLEAYKELNISDVKEEAADIILTANKYDKLDVSWIERPDCSTIEEIIYGATKSPTISYKYLYKTTDRDRFSENIELRRKELESEKNKLRILEEMSNGGAFLGSRIWLQELDHLEKIITEGLRTNWLFENFGKFKYE